MAYKRLTTRNVVTKPRNIQLLGPPRHGNVHAPRPTVCAWDPCAGGIQYPHYDTRYNLGCFCSLACQMAAIDNFFRSHSRTAATLAPSV